MDYKEQYREIERLTKSIKKKARKFIRHTDGPYYDDLLSVIKDLKEAENFLK